MKLVVAGDFELNGEIVCEGRYVDGSIQAYGHYSGSGGAVWIECATLSGAGTINVNGGRQLGSFGGGGGRAAVWQTVAANTNAFTGTITAFGAMYDNGVGTANQTPGASCGTIFYHNAGDAADGGLLVLDGKNGANDTGDSVNSSQPSRTDFPGEDGAAAFKNADIVVKRRAMLHLTEDVTVRDVLMTTDSGRGSSVIRLNGYTLFITGREHRHISTLAPNMGKGWSGTVANGSAEGGAIRWLTHGMMILLR